MTCTRTQTYEKQLIQIDDENAVEEKEDWQVFECPCFKYNHGKNKYEYNYSNYTIVFNNTVSQMFADENLTKINFHQREIIDHPFIDEFPLELYLYYFIRETNNENNYEEILDRYLFENWNPRTFISTENWELIKTKINETQHGFNTLERLRNESLGEIAYYLIFLDIHNNEEYNNLSQQILNRINNNEESAINKWKRDNVYEDRFYCADEIKNSISLENKFYNFFLFSKDEYCNYDLNESYRRNKYLIYVIENFTKKDVIKPYLYFALATLAICALTGAYLYTDLNEKLTDFGYNLNFGLPLLFYGAYAVILWNFKKQRNIYFTNKIYTPLLRDN